MSSPWHIMDTLSFFDQKSTYILHRQFCRLEIYEKFSSNTSNFRPHKYCNCHKSELCTTRIQPIFFFLELSTLYYYRTRCSFALQPVVVPTPYLATSSITATFIGAHVIAVPFCEPQKLRHTLHQVTISHLMIEGKSDGYPTSISPRQARPAPVFSRESPKQV